MEDYLEAIFHIVRKKHAARGKDISAFLGVNRSSVTGALHTLSGKGLVNYSPYDIITLTPNGATIAKNIVFRHTVLKEFLRDILGIDEESAENNACNMEHAVSRQVLDRIARFVSFFKSAPDISRRWTEESDEPNEESE